MSAAQYEQLRKDRHQLRNCLGIIRGFSELLLEDLPTHDHAEAPLKVILSTVDRVLTLVDQSIVPIDALKTKGAIASFCIQVEADILNMQKTIRELLETHRSEEFLEFQKDLKRILQALEEFFEAVSTLSSKK